MKPWEVKLAAGFFAAALLVAVGISTCHAEVLSIDNPLCGRLYVKQRVDTWARIHGSLRIVRSVWVCKSYTTISKLQREGM